MKYIWAQTTGSYNQTEGMKIMSRKKRNRGELLTGWGGANKWGPRENARSLSTKKEGGEGGKEGSSIEHNCEGCTKGPPVTSSN